MPKVKQKKNLSSVPGWIRTSDPLLRRQLLYPLSYRDTSVPVIRNSSTTLGAWQVYFIGLCGLKLQGIKSVLLEYL